MKTNCIVTKFYIGQELYLVEKVEKERDCGVCKGTGSVVLPDIYDKKTTHYYTCPACDGTGRVKYRNEDAWCVAPSKVRVEKVCTTQDQGKFGIRTCIDYMVRKWISADTYVIHYRDEAENVLFDDLEEAQAEAQRRTKAESKKWSKVAEVKGKVEPQE
jgi:excinuclease UvrABC ATPase subunit